MKSASVLVVSLSLNSVLHVTKYLLALFIHKGFDSDEVGEVCVLLGSLHGCSP